MQCERRTPDSVLPTPSNANCSLNYAPMLECKIYQSNAAKEFTRLYRLRKPRLLRRATSFFADEFPAASTGFARTRAVVVLDGLIV